MFPPLTCVSLWAVGLKVKSPDILIVLEGPREAMQTVGLALDPRCWGPRLSEKHSALGSLAVGASDLSPHVSVAMLAPP